MDVKKKSFQWKIVNVKGFAYWLGLVENDALVYEFIWKVII